MASDVIAAGVERALVQGDLSKLTADERLSYYRSVCDSLGLNPLTQPFAYITLSGRLTLYARKDCADQLRRINNVSLEIVSRTLSEDGVYKVLARATLPDGRRDEDEGAVYVGALKGEALANAHLKAITKAKRRVTLSVCGLGFLDETEVIDLPAAVVEQTPAALPAPLPAPPKSTLPATGQELYDRLVTKEKALVEARLCRPGELVAYVANGGARAGAGTLMPEWGADTIRMAVAWVTEFIEAHRVPIQPDPAELATVEERNAVSLALAQKGMVWEQAVAKWEGLPATMGELLAVDAEDLLGRLGELPDAAPAKKAPARKKTA